MEWLDLGTQLQLYILSVWRCGRGHPGGRGECEERYGRKHHDLSLHGEMSISYIARCHDTVGAADMAVTGKWRFDLLGLERRPRIFGILAKGTLAMALVVAVLSNAPARQGYAQQAGSGPVSVVQPGAPGTPSRRLPPSTSAVAPARSQADIEFMQGMIMHHAQAVEMTALIPSHTTDKAIRTLGERISLSQADEIKFMKRWLVARNAPVSRAMPGMPDMDNGGKPMTAMPGMLTPQQMRELEQAEGAEFDRKFLTGMMQHHNGALVMVKQLFDTPGAGQDAELFDFATDVDNTQRAEIKIMEGMLKEKE